MKKITALSLIAAITLTIAGCSERDASPEQEKSGTTVTTALVTDEGVQGAVDTTEAAKTASIAKTTAEVARTLQTSETTAVIVTDKPVVTEKPIVTEPKPDKPSDVVWKEVSVPENVSQLNGHGAIFELKNTLTGYDSFYNYQLNVLIFKGSVISAKDYEVSFTTDEGEKIGPYVNGIVEVEISHIYKGKSPIDGNIIKVNTPWSVSCITNDTPNPMEKGEYIFITQILDDEYSKFIKKCAPNHKGAEEKYANVVLSKPHTLLPLENDNIAVYKNFFSHDDETMKKVIPYSLEKNIKQIDKNNLRSKYIELSGEDFDIGFKKLLDYIENLPNEKNYLVNEGVFQ